jgi:hypothetical protein
MLWITLLVLLTSIGSNFCARVKKAGNAHAEGVSGNGNLPDVKYCLSVFSAQSGIDRLLLRG